jgi:multidrug efflux pump subunit AcrB
MPSGVRGPFFNDEFGDTFGNIYAFTSDSYGFAEMRDYVEDIRRELLQVRDVGKVDILGEQAEKIWIEMSHRKLTTLGIDPLSLFQVLGISRPATTRCSCASAGTSSRWRASARSASRPTAGCSGSVTSPRSAAATWTRPKA